MSKAKQLVEKLNRLNLNEASLGRLVQHLNKGECLAFISAERSEVSEKENQQNTLDLRKYASNFHKNLKLGYIKAKGGYVELVDGQKVEVTDEDSIILFAPPDEFDILKEFALSMGRKFKQDSVMLVDPSGEAYWVATIPNSSVGSIGSKKYVGKFKSTRIGDYFSMVGKKSFSFTQLSESKKIIPKSTERRLNEYFWNRLSECVKQGVSFYDYFFENKHTEKIDSVVKP